MQTHLSRQSQLDDFVLAIKERGREESFAPHFFATPTIAAFEAIIRNKSLRRRCRRYLSGSELKFAQRKSCTIQVYVYLMH